MAQLTVSQKDQFWRDGYLIVEQALSPIELESLRSAFSVWVDTSLSHQTDYGETLDGRARFDLDPVHNATQSGLRRVQSPEEISEAFRNVMRNARTVDICAELIGPAIRFHHGKVNSKLPGMPTEVKFHQDFTFQPMSNDDVITCLLFMDEVTEENGPLQVVPGSHKGPLFSLWHEGVFTGAVAEEVVAQHKDQIVTCTGAAGAACLMHSSLLHGSAGNLSANPRTLYLATYYSDDAIELSPNALPSRLTHELVRGEPSGRVRCTPYEMALPEVPQGTSFFAQQSVQSDTSCHA
ncbi:phytanoyl-CoA dioxygenase family protein [Luminiphilus sp.]|nr:phytanoyl-CoA dioxygenase family protein [Luminiphilus sp.]MBT6351561.1 phytanoyl-CoA dioxygenase family protein [Halieaceae bacterium]MDA8555541.1 phytanoyl-CoA dioxygenase family protein [Luminiphilus sp.]MDB2688640.1 phytanoyl-CoA dioxygenase family protein [Luminiphilus sp.]MDC0572003.1 phytanoyl-CoA dioxygenase family protein [Luminiphilus sp.]